MRLFTLLVLAGPMLVPVAAGADAALNRVLIEQLEMAVAADDQPELRSFVLRPFGALFTVDSLSADTVSFEPWPHILSQLPPEAAGLPPSQPVRVLELETCGPLLDPYGLAERDDLGFDYGDIDRIRLNLAFDAEDLGVPFSLAEANALRDDTGRDALSTLNARLFRLHTEGRTDVPHMVLDFSEGCGSEPFTLMTIRPPPRIDAVNVIPDFYLSACEARFADAWDLSQCPWWNAAPEQLLANGLYHWQGRLRSGEIRTGQFRVDREWHSWDREVTVLR